MIKYILCFLSVVFFFSGCQSVKDGLTGKKRANSDEFLIQKKNPLVLPPEFEELPIPKIEKNSEIESNSEDFDINKLLGNLPEENIIESSTTGIDNSLEKSILKKINKN